MKRLSSISTLAGLLFTLGASGAERTQAPYGPFSGKLRVSEGGVLSIDSPRLEVGGKRFRVSYPESGSWEDLEMNPARALCTSFGYSTVGFALTSKLHFLSRPARFMYELDPQVGIQITGWKTARRGSESIEWMTCY